MTADAFKLYHTAKEYFGDGVLDMDNDEFMLALFLSTSNAATLTNGNNEFGDLTNQVATGNGYTRPGVLLTNVMWTESTGTITWDTDDVTFTASGGSIVARFAVIYANETKAAPTGTITQPLICMSTLDNAPADVTITTGNSLTIQMNASGVFQLSGGS